MRIQFIQNIIDIIRNKKNRTIRQYNRLKNNNFLSISNNILKDVTLNIIGQNNTIIIENITLKGKISISIYGDNNKIIIHSGCKIGEHLLIKIGNTATNMGKANNTEFIIHEKTSIEAMQYLTFNCNTKCSIGKNCMIALNVVIFNTDAHPVMALDSGVILNKVKEINIGEHCWIGTNATILKNTTIADDTIIGWGSVVSGKHTTSHCAIAGNPAKIVKENITWDKDSSKGYVQNDFQ